MRLPFAGNFSFAHFGGLTTGKKSGEEEGEDMRHAESEECDEEGEDESTAKNEDGKDGKKGKKAEKKKVKKAKPSEDSAEDDSDEDQDEDEDGDENDGDDKKATSAAFKRGRKAERQRTASVLSNPASARNLELAAKLLCTTSMSGNAIVALLESTPAARGGRLGDRMEHTGDRNIGGGTGATDLNRAAAIDKSWEQAMKSV